MSQCGFPSVLQYQGSLKTEEIHPKVQVVNEIKMSVKTRPLISKHMRGGHSVINYDQQ